MLSHRQLLFPAFACSNLCTGSEVLRVEVGTNGGACIPRLLQQLGHECDAVAEAAAGALCNLALNTTVAKAIVKHGGIQPLSKALQVCMCVWQSMDRCIP